MKGLSTVLVLGLAAIGAEQASAQSAASMAAPRPATGSLGTVLQGAARPSAASPMGMAPMPQPAMPAQQPGSGPVPGAAPPPIANGQATIICKAPALSADATFTYRLDYANFTVTTPAGATRPVTMSAQEITWDDNGPDGAVKNTLQRFSGQLTQVKGSQTFTFACEPG